MQRPEWSFWFATNSKPTPKGLSTRSLSLTKYVQFVQHLQFCYIPKHGSWLNTAANELSSLTRQCVADQRFGDTEALQRQQQLGQRIGTTGNAGLISR